MTTYSGGHSGVADYVTGLQTRGDLESCLRKHLEHDSDQGPLLVALGVDVIGLNRLTIPVASLPATSILLLLLQNLLMQQRTHTFNLVPVVMNLRLSSLVRMPSETQRLQKKKC